MSSISNNYGYNPTVSVPVVAANPYSTTNTFSTNNIGGSSPSDFMTILINILRQLLSSLGQQNSLPTASAPTNNSTTQNLNGSIVVSGLEGLKRYIAAVDNNGTVNNDKIHGGIKDGVGAVNTYDARTSIVEGYAAEFYAGERIRNPQFMSQMTTMLWRDFNSTRQADRDAATFALVAARYKNAGGAYNNNALAKLLEKTNNDDLVVGGVGTTDVETLAAVTSALKRGTLQLGRFLILLEERMHKIKSLCRILLNIKVLLMLSKLVIWAQILPMEVF